MKCAGESMPLAISRIPTRSPSFERKAIKIIARIAYSHVLENIAAKIRGNFQIKDKNVLYWAGVLAKGSTVIAPVGRSNAAARTATAGLFHVTFRSGPGGNRGSGYYPVP